MTIYHVYLVSTAIVEVEADGEDEANALALEHTPTYAFGDNVTVADTQKVVRATHHVWVRTDA